MALRKKLSFALAVIFAVAIQTGLASYSSKRSEAPIVVVKKYSVNMRVQDGDSKNLVTMVKDLIDDDNEGCNGGKCGGYIIDEKTGTILENKSHYHSKKGSLTDIKPISKVESAHKINPAYERKPVPVRKMEVRKSEPGYYYQPYVEFGATRFFNDISTAGVGVDFFIPLWQTPTTIVFTDARFYDRSGVPFEGNIHLGFRRLFPDEQRLFGIYSAFDRKRSELGNYYNQLTFGAEVWFNKLFIGGNFYQPIGDSEKRINSFENYETINNDIYVTTDQRSEKALQGGDAQIGYEINDGLVGYIGGHYFKGKDTDNIFGPSARLTYDWVLDNGKRIMGIFDKIGLEAAIQNSKARGTTGCISLKLRVGLSPELNNNKLPGVAKHMVDLIRRDVDIVSGSTENKHGKKLLSKVVVVTTKDDLIKQTNAKGSKYIVIDGKLQLTAEDLTSISSGRMKNKHYVFGDSIKIKTKDGRKIKIPVERGEGSFAGIVIDGQEFVSDKDFKKTVKSIKSAEKKAAVAAKAAGEGVAPLSETKVKDLASAKNVEEMRKELAAKLKAIDEKAKSANFETYSMEITRELNALLTEIRKLEDSEAAVAYKKSNGVEEQSIWRSDTPQQAELRKKYGKVFADEVAAVEKAREYVTMKTNIIYQIRRCNDLSKLRELRNFAIAYDLNQIYDERERTLGYSWLWGGTSSWDGGSYTVEQIKSGGAKGCIEERQRTYTNAINMLGNQMNFSDMRYGVNSDDKKKAAMEFYEVMTGYITQANDLQGKMNKDMSTDTILMSAISVYGDRTIFNKHMAELDKFKQATLRKLNDRLVAEGYTVAQVQGFFGP